VGQHPHGTVLLVANGKAKTQNFKSCVANMAAMFIIFTIQQVGIRQLPITTIFKTIIFEIAKSKHYK
jgi:hypothetical protein